MLASGVPGPHGIDSPPVVEHPVKSGEGHQPSTMVTAASDAQLTTHGVEAQMCIHQGAQSGGVHEGQLVEVGR